MGVKMTPKKRKPRLSVWKFASCDGCQLSLLDCEDELLAVAGELEIAYFVEASRAMVKGPYDLTLVDGSITTAHDAETIKHVRRASKYLIAIGTCANSGGIQALRNFTDVNDYINAVYSKPEIYRDPEGIHPHRGPRQGGFRPQRLPHQQAPAP